MIGFLYGEVIFSDGNEIILLTQSGVGHQIFFNKVLVEGSKASCFVSHIVKEDSEELFGFLNLREKKLFELLLSVKGVGPKSAFSMINFLGIDQIIQAITLDSKVILKKAPGIGPKAAAQMILDLKNKISKVKMFSDNPTKKLDFKIQSEKLDSNFSQEDRIGKEQEDLIGFNKMDILEDALLACKELGFGEENIIPLAQKIMGENQILKAEQLVHLVLKQI